MKKKDVASAEFIKKLQTEAQLQTRLHQNKVFPAQLDIITSFIGRYPWQCLTVVSGVTSLIIEFYKVL